MAVAIVSRRTSFLALGALFVAAIAVRLPGISLPLIEWHGWRQTQTAFTALWLRDHPFDVFHAQLPIFGPPFELPIEFPVFQWLAALVMHVLDADTAMRVTGLATFMLTASLIWVLVRRYAGGLAAFAACAAFLFVPLNLLFGKGSLPEFTATAGALGWLIAGLRWREGAGARWYALSFVAGTLGMLAKPTTPVFWTVPLALAAIPGEPRGLFAWLRTRLDPRLVALAVVPVLFAYAWQSYGDSVKAPQVAASFLMSTSEFSRHFFYSDLRERTDPAIWQRNDEWISQLVIGAGFVPFALLGLWAALRGRQRLLWSGVALAAVLPVAVFFGGYFKHDYYWTAVTPETSIFTGLGVAWLWRRVRVVPLRAGVALTVALATIITMQSGEQTWRRAFPPLNDYEGVLPRARELARLTRPDELTVVLGRGFDPDLLYYARRRGAMITAENAGAPLYRSLAAGPYTKLFSWDPAHDAVDVMRWWSWDGIVGLHTYTIGQGPGEVRGAQIVATDDTSLFDARRASARSLLAAPLHVPCDLVSHAVPAGARGTWLRVQADSSARFWATPLLAPQAVRGVVVLDPALAVEPGTVAIYCDGPSEIVIDAALDAPPP